MTKMNSINKLNGLKEWAEENLNREDATIMQHDLNAVIDVVIELNLKIDVLIDVLKFTRTRLIYKNMATREIDCLFKQMGIKP